MILNSRMQWYLHLECEIRWLICLSVFFHYRLIPDEKQISVLYSFYSKPAREEEYQSDRSMGSET